MSESEYLHMYMEEERHWWYVGMRSLVFSLVPPSSLPSNPAILDAGCGTGYSMVWFRDRYGARVTGVDYHRYGLSLTRRRGEADLVCADVGSLPLATNAFDLVSCFDVLSVMNDPDSRVRAVAEFMRVLKPGGRLVVRVPAYEWLRSGHDTAVFNRHRYSGTELEGTLSGAGFRVERLTFANTLLFPAAAFWRLSKRAGLAPAGSDVSRRTRGGAWLNGALTLCLRAEAAMLRHASRLPFGLSLFAVAIKP